MDICSSCLCGSSWSCQQLGSPQSIACHTERHLVVLPSFSWKRSRGLLQPLFTWKIIFNGDYQVVVCHHSSLPGGSRKHSLPEAVRQFQQPQSQTMLNPCIVSLSSTGNWEAEEKTHFSKFFVSLNQGGLFCGDSLKFNGQNAPLFMLAAHAPARQGSCTTMNFIILKIKWDSKRGREKSMETHNPWERKGSRGKMLNSLSSGYRICTQGQHWVLQLRWEEHRSLRSTGALQILALVQYFKSCFFNPKDDLQHLVFNGKNCFNWDGS